MNAIQPDNAIPASESPRKVIAPELPKATGPKGASGQMVVFVVVLCVSAATILTMRRYGMRAGVASAQEAPLEVPKIDTDKARSYERIMNDLKRAAMPLDVALEHLRESPFLPRETRSAVVVPQALEGSPSNPAVNEARRQQLQQALDALHINMLMRDIARINGEYYRVGDSVGGYFTVRAIHGRSVILGADDMEFELSMDEHNKTAGGGSGFFKPGGK